MLILGGDRSIGTGYFGAIVEPLALSSFQPAPLTLAALAAKYLTGCRDTTRPICGGATSANSSALQPKPMIFIYYVMRDSNQCGSASEIFIF